MYLLKCNFLAACITQIKNMSKYLPTYRYVGTYILINYIKNIFYMKQEVHTYILKFLK